MKIKLSKNIWEEMGKKTGWMKTAQTAAPATAPAATPASTTATPAANPSPAPSTPTAGTQTPAGQTPQMIPTPTVKAIADAITKVSGDIGPGGALEKEAQALENNPQLKHTISALVGQLKAVMSILEKYQG